MKVAEPKRLKKMDKEHEALEEKTRKKLEEYIFEYDKWFKSLSDKQLETMFRNLPRGERAASMEIEYPKAFLRIIDKLRKKIAGGKH